MSTIDLNSPPPNHKYSVTVDREETGPERGVRLFKEIAVFVLASGFVVAISYYCYLTLTSSTASAEEKKWAMSVLSAAAAGLVGYLVRK